MKIDDTDGNNQAGLPPFSLQSQLVHPGAVASAGPVEQICAARRRSCRGVVDLPRQHRGRVGFLPRDPADRATDWVDDIAMEIPSPRSRDPPAINMKTAKALGLAI